MDWPALVDQLIEIVFALDDLRSVLSFRYFSLFCSLHWLNCMHMARMVWDGTKAEFCLLGHLGQNASLRPGPKGRYLFSFATASGVLDCGERRTASASPPCSSSFAQDRTPPASHSSLKPPWPWGSQASAAATFPRAARSLPSAPPSHAGPSRGPRLSATPPSKPKVICSSTTAP